MNTILWTVVGVIGAVIAVIVILSIALIVGIVLDWPDNDELDGSVRLHIQNTLGSLVEVVEILEHAVASMANRPEKVEMEFGASLSTECNLCILPAAEDAEFRVKLTWGRDSIKSDEGQRK